MPLDAPSSVSRDRDKAPSGSSGSGVELSFRVANPIKGCSCHCPVAPCGKVRSGRRPITDAPGRQTLRWVNTFGRPGPTHLPHPHHSPSKIQKILQQQSLQPVSLSLSLALESPIAATGHEQVSRDRGDKHGIAHPNCRDGSWCPGHSSSFRRRRMLAVVVRSPRPSSRRSGPMQRMQVPM